MKSVVSCARRLSVVSRRRLTVLCLLLAAGCSLACSIPNLEKPECGEARNTIKEFYSVHFGNDMRPSEDYLRLREKYLTDDWKFFISKNLQGKRDYFTSTENYPKAFRIGECEVVAPNKTVFQVVFFWKDDTRSEQRETRVETVKENGQWLINRTY